MENSGVLCNVSECMHHCCGSKCNLEKIEVTNERTSADSMSDPHFCKSYEKR